MHLDDVDRGVLYALQVDGRASFRLVGEVLGVSDQTVARRYERLRDRHLLRVRGMVDTGSVALESWVLRVTASPEAAAEVAEALARRPDTSWITLCAGGTEIVALATGAGVEALLLEALPRTRQVHDVRADEVLHVFGGGPGRPFTTGGPLSADQVAALLEHVPPTTAAVVRVDAADQVLLGVLGDDGCVTAEHLAAACRVSVSTVRRRIRSLRAAGVLHFGVDVALDVFELPVRTLLWVQVDLSALEEVGSRLADHPEVAFAAATTGRTNVFVSASTPDAGSLYRYLTRDVAGLPGVLSVQTSRSLRVVKGHATRYPAHGTRRRRDPTHQQHGG